MDKEIPYGYCHCGCGGKTTIAKQSHTAKGHVRGEPKKYIIHHHKNWRKGEDSQCWKGGRSMNRGYAYIYIPDHPRANMRGYVLESVLIAEKALGKPLPPKAKVHHHTPDQLVICENQGYHMLLHQRQRALEACGNVHWRSCRICHQYDDPENLVFYAHHALHKSCQKKDNKRRSQAKKENKINV